MALRRQYRRTIVTACDTTSWYKNNYVSAIHTVSNFYNYDRLSISSKLETTNETKPVFLQQRYRDGAHCTQRYYYRHQSWLEGEERIYFVGCLRRTPSWTCVLRWTNSWYEPCCCWWYYPWCYCFPDDVTQGLSWCKYLRMPDWWANIVSYCCIVGYHPPMLVHDFLGVTL